MKIEVTPLSMDCISCDSVAVLQSAEKEGRWPRELSYLCPNGHRIQVTQISDPQTMPPISPTDPSLPRTYKFRHPSLEAEIDLFQVSLNLRRKLGKSYDSANSHLNELEAYVNAAKLQFHRFLMLGQFQHKHPPMFSLKREDAEENAKRNQEYFTILQIRFTELHFFLIATDKIEKHLMRFRKAVEQIGKNSDSADWRRQWKIVKSNFAKAFVGHKSARDYLEHKDEKIRNGISPEVTFSEEAGSVMFSYFNEVGQHKAVVDIDILTAAYDSFADWVYSFPDLD